MEKKPKRWRAYQYADSTRFIISCAPIGSPGSKFNEIAQVFSGKENADLIAAAPEMLEMLKMAEFIIAKFDRHAPDLVSIRYAISKAEGQS